ncbi:MAG TPA: Npt1/Npt2 family nucleotide transporter [Vicinamibacterales bacterium]|nr:Npt1/Npt2 family nucleotide transporter [Vicinamibacterales bacterium]
MSSERPLSPERSSGSLVARLLSPIAQLREGEATTALLMFAYSFLAMTSYNIVKPITRSQFITSLGPDNLPWVQFVAGMLIGVLMQGYSRVIALVPRRWTVPVTQAGMIVLLLLFWVLFTRVGAEWVSVGFYVLGLILGLLLISQFWTIANDVYEPRQAKRLFGMIGGGASLGGAMGAGLTAGLVQRLGQNTMLIVSAGILSLCMAIVVWVLRREKSAGRSDATKTGETEEGVSGAEAFRMLRDSKHLQIISLVIAFAAVGAAIVEQQLNMAAASQGKGDAIAAYLAKVAVYLSLVGFVIQVALTSRIHRFLGIGFALLILPVTLGFTGALMLLNGAAWTAALARIVDTSLRYTVDKTSREILFLPLPLDLKYRAKPFIDVTMDRVSKGLGALLILVLIKPWGLALTWQQLSYASLSMIGLWMFFAMRARREYLAAFRRSIEQQDVKPAEIRLDTADLSTIETLVIELSHPEARRVLYAMDLLESLDKRHLVTPLLLRHESPEVRARALAVAEAAGPQKAAHWLPAIAKALKDTDGSVRVAAVKALAALQREEAAELMRPYLRDADPQLVITAAGALAESPLDTDRAAAEDVLRELASDTREQSVTSRLEVARTLGQVQNPSFRPLLVPLMYDADLSVAREAILSAGQLGATDFLFVPPLVSLMRNRLLKPAARTVLVGYGEQILDTLAYFLRDTDEDIWIRRHIPSTLALIPSQRSIDILAAALEDPDGFVRYKAGAAIERIRRDRPDLTIAAVVVERQVLQEAMRAFSALTLHHNLFVVGGLDADSVLGRVLIEKHQRARNRIYRLLGLVHSPDDIAAVRAAIDSADSRLRSGAMEYLDNLLAGDVRRKVMLLVEEMPAEERIRRGNVLFKTRVRDVDDTIAQLVHDDDQVIAAAAIQLVEKRQMWTLADDLEHVLANRPARDWYVFEAASWALAAQRMSPERRRALWLEPLPAVELVDRIRRVHLFDFASVDELFRLAALGRQVRHEAGRLIYEAGKPPETLQFLLDGRISFDSPADVSREMEAPAILGFEAVLEGSPVRANVRALETVICLSLTTEQFLSLLSENVEIAQGIFRLLIDRRGAPGWHTVLHGRISETLQQQADSGLSAVERIVLLQSSPLLTRATVGQLAGLAAIGRHIALTPGIDPLAGAEPSILVVLSGAVRVERDGAAPETAEPGDAVGIYETLGGATFPVRAEVTQPGHALRFVRSDVFDVLADNIDLLQGIFSGLLRGPQAADPHVHQ